MFSIGAFQNSHRVLSIIVPILNEEKALPETLHNLAECAPGCELILVDGGGTDGTRAAVKTFTAMSWIWMLAVWTFRHLLQIGGARQETLERFYPEVR